MYAVTIRPATARDRATFPWEPYRISYELKKRGRPIVVTVRGTIYLMLGENNRVLYQNDSAAVPGLLRMTLKYIAMQGMFYDDDRDRKRAKAQRDYEETMRKFHETVAWARQQTKED